MSSNTIETDDHDYQVQYEDEDDDERTIDEEEQLNTDDEQNELAHLQADADTPLDELLKLYSKNPPIINNTSHDEESFSSSDPEDDDCRHHLLHVNGDLLPDNDDDDTEDSLYEPEIVKFINVGDEYQAHVEYNSSNEYCDDREIPVDELLWSSSSINDSDNENIDEYLKTIHTEYPSSDDEISLQTLFNCQLNTELALVKFRQLPNKKIYSYPAWSIAEIQQFEEGLREYGKDFFRISIFKCSNRSICEIIHFYYQWKKTERYQLFIEEQKCIIEKFIEEQEQQLCNVTGVVDSKKASSCLSNNFKFHGSSLMSFVTIRQQETKTTTTTKRSFDQIDNDDKTLLSSKKTSSAEATATIV